jgi:two-component system, response regulator PdtaR
MPASVEMAGAHHRAEHPAVILVVDDDELVREMMASFLSMKGYRVLEAGSADEAVSLLAAPKPVDVVVTDVRMPGQLDGLGLASWIRDHRPEIRVLVTSGHTSAAQQAASVSDGPLIPKPYQPKEVVRRVQALTEEPH